MILWAVTYLRLAVVCLALGAFASDAAAATATEIALAKQAYERGQQDYRLAQYHEALEEFSAAYKLSEAPALLFSIGQCHRQLGDLDNAARFYRNYLNLGTRERCQRGDGAGRARRDRSPARRARREKRLQDTQRVAIAKSSADAAAATIETTRLLTTDARHKKARQRKSAGIALLTIGLAALVGGTAAALLARSDRSRLVDDANNGDPYDPSLGVQIQRADGATWPLRRRRGRHRDRRRPSDLGSARGATMRYLVFLLCVAGCGIDVPNGKLGCATDGTCPPGYVCGYDGRCYRKGTAPPPFQSAAGGACALDGDCASMHCADGVCCDTACDQACESCNAPGSIGTCTPSVKASPRRMDIHRASPTIRPRRRARRPAFAMAPALARSHRPDAIAAPAGTLTHADCTARGTCGPTTTLSCMIGCDATGTECQPLSDNGTGCIGDVECASGHCTDGVCCDTDSGSCTGCNACNVVGSVGTCVPVPVNEDPHGTCGGEVGCVTACDGNGACLAPGLCNTSCADVPNGTAAGVVPYYDKAKRSAQTCDAGRHCTGVLTTVDCPGTLVCSSTIACLTSCDWSTLIVRRPRRRTRPCIAQLMNHTCAAGEASTGPPARATANARRTSVIPAAATRASVCVEREVPGDRTVRTGRPLNPTYHVRATRLPRRGRAHWP